LRRRPVPLKHRPPNELSEDENTMPHSFLLTRFPFLSRRPAMRARIIAATVPLFIFGCTQASRLNLATTTGGDAALFGQFRAYDSHTGQPLTFEQVARRCATADVVLFGEEHSNAVCNQLEAQLLSTLAARPRPVALAMEFFETDTQASLNEYLEGQIDEPAFRESTRQGRAYVLAHRPLIEMCRAACIPVIAANAPRRLVHEYRTSDLDYCDFLAGLNAVDQAWLPPQNEYLAGQYHERFIETMSQHREAPSRPATPPTSPATQPGAPSMPGGAPAMPPVMPGSPSMPPAPAPAATAPASSPAGGESEGMARLLMDLATAAEGLTRSAREVSQTLEQLRLATQPASPTTEPAVSQPAKTMPERMDPEAFYRAQLLWDETMADSVADFRAQCPTSRVMLIVGRFHVASDGGTAQKLRRRRPADRIVTVVYSGTTDTELAFDPDDCSAGDIAICGIQPPEPKNGKPARMPTMTPPATAPTSAGPSGAPPAGKLPPTAPPSTESPPVP
jgi:uncharacterized iron-regulated protein